MDNKAILLDLSYFYVTCIDQKFPLISTLLYSSPLR